MSIASISAKSLKGAIILYAPTVEVIYVPILKIALYVMTGLERKKKEKKKIRYEIRKRDFQEKRRNPETATLQEI